MKKIFVEAVMLLFAHAGFTQTNTDKAPLIIREQGSFLAGGTVIKGEGTYDHLDQTNLQGQTLHGDHAYVSYQIPAVSHPYRLSSYLVWVGVKFSNAKEEELLINDASQIGSKKFDFSIE